MDTRCLDAAARSAHAPSGNHPSRTRRPVHMGVVLVLVQTVLAGCGHKTAGATSSAGPSPTVSNGVPLDASGCPTDNTIALAKTKFVLHAGLAFGTFHRYLYKPYRAGTFAKGASGRLTALVKAAATAVFDAHEVRLAISDVKADPALCRKIIAPLQKLATSFDGLTSRIKGGDTTGLDTDDSTAAGVETASSSAGTTITESTDESAG